MQESTIQNQIIRALGSRPDTRVFRNQVGFGFSGTVQHRHENTVILANARPVTMGLAVGSADLVGWHTLEITPAMVGKKVAVFLSVEVKSKSGCATAEQLAWAAAVRKFGGISMIVRSPEEAVTGLQTLDIA